MLIGVRACHTHPESFLARRPRHSGFEWFAIKGELSHRGRGFTEEQHQV